MKSNVRSVVKYPRNRERPEAMRDNRIAHMAILGMSVLDFASYVVNWRLSYTTRTPELKEVNITIFDRYNIRVRDFLEHSPDHRLPVGECPNSMNKNNDLLRPSCGGFRTPSIQKIGRCVD